MKANRTRKSSDLPKFSSSRTKEFISIYKHYECLWNAKSVSYRRHDLKRQAIRSIASRFQLSERDTRRKIHTLRGTYVIERRKVLEGRLSGEVYEPNLAWYESMAFLDGFIIFRKKNLVNSEEPRETPSDKEGAEWQDSQDISNHFNFECKYDITDMNAAAPETAVVEAMTRSPADDPLSSIHNEVDAEISSKKNGGIKKQKRKQAETASDMHEELDAFARSIVLQLKKLPEEHVIRAMDEIQQVVSKRRLLALDVK